MIKDMQQLQKFILWAKKNKLKSFKSGEIAFEFSDLALVTDEELANTLGYESNLEETAKQEETLQTQKEEEDLLFWSSK